jgi:hypothetical protein
VRMVSVARKLSTIEERRQDQSRLFQREQGKGHDLGESVLGSSPGEDFSVARYLSTIYVRRERRRKLFVSAGRLQEQRRELSWILVLVKMLGFGTIISSYDIQRYISNDQAYEKLLGSKD